MNSSNLLHFPKDQRDARWWASPLVTVRWSTRRWPSAGAITASGPILLSRLAVPEGSRESSEHREVGRIWIVKPFLWQGCTLVEHVAAMSPIFGQMASSILAGDEYRDDFRDWAYDEFQIDTSGDPVFVLNLEVDEPYRDPDHFIAAHAALDALSTFGSATSPLIGSPAAAVVNASQLGPHGCGLWSWLHALRAKRWRDSYVTLRPQV